jgi:hypothetical protein
MSLVPKGNVSYDPPVEIDFKPHKKSKKYKLPTSLKLMLSTLASGKETSPSRWGFFTRTQADRDEVEADIEELVHRMRKRATVDEHYSGLAAMEADNASKLTDASGFPPYAYIVGDKYPFKVEKKGGASDPTIGLAVGTMFKKAAMSQGLSEEDLKRCSISSCMKQLPAVRYRKGSSYGAFIYVPGSSRDSSVSLVAHGLTGQLAGRRALKEKRSFIECGKEIWAEMTGSHFYMDTPEAMMLLSRARPISRKKPLKNWRWDSKTQKLKATTGQFGKKSARRAIRPVPCWINIIATALAQCFSTAVHGIPGFHVGHILFSHDLMFACFTVWGWSQTGTHTEDISGFDDSVGPGDLQGWRYSVEAFVGWDDATERYFNEIDHLPLITAGFETSQDEQCSILEHAYGVVTGEQLTTMKGTNINMNAKVYCVMKATGLSVDEALRGCANFAVINGVSLKQCFWGVLLKGDDCIVFFKKDRLSSQDFIDGMADLGFKTDVEPSEIFLMNAIDTRLEKIRYRRDYKDAPPALREGQCFTAHGLLSRRIGFRGAHVEYPTKDAVPARYGILSNCTDSQWHPEAEFGLSILLKYLNRYDDQVWTLESLRRYATSARGRKDMQAYAKRRGRNDPFMREMLRRRSEYALGSNLSLERNQLSSGSHTLDEVLDDALSVSFSGFSDLPAQLQQAYHSADLEEKEDAVVFDGGKQADADIVRLLKASCAHLIASGYCDRDV